MTDEAVEPGPGESWPVGVQEWDYEAFVQNLIRYQGASEESARREADKFLIKLKAMRQPVTFTNRQGAMLAQQELAMERVNGYTSLPAPQQPSRPRSGKKRKRRR
jgi:hypothetical protein